MAKNKTLKGTRRKNGEGSIYQEKNGRWVGSVRMKQDDGTRIRKKVYGKTQSEVAKKLLDLTGRMVFLKNSNLTNKALGELFKEWLLIFKKFAVSPKTFDGNFRNYKLYIKPYIDKMKIEDLTTPILQQIINELLGKGLSTNTVKKVKFLFNQFFEHAVDCGWVLTNPTIRIKIRNRDVRLTDSENEYKAIKPEMRMKFVSALNNNSFLKPLCMTAMFAGLRIGEILALRWENIDFENKTISVLNGIVQIPVFDEEGSVLSRKTVIGKTKTACSVREVPIPDILVEALQDWKKEQWVKEQLGKANLLSPESIVFCNTDGSVRTYSGTRRIFDRFTKKHGFFGKISFHTLRHTYSNMLFEVNENPKIIQALLGHKSVKTTLTVYNSIDTSYYKEATNKLNKLFNSEKMAEYRELEKKRDIPALKKPIEEIDDMDEDPEIAILEKMLAERRARRKNQDCEM